MQPLVSGYAANDRGPFRKRKFLPAIQRAFMVSHLLARCTFYTQRRRLSLVQDLFRHDTMLSYRIKLKHEVTVWLGSKAPFQMQLSSMQILFQLWYRKIHHPCWDRVGASQNLLHMKMSRLHTSFDELVSAAVLLSETQRCPLSLSAKQPAHPIPNKGKH